MGVHRKLEKVVKNYTLTMEVYKDEKYFQQHIIPHFHKHRMQKNIARALLHCKRD